MKNLVKVLSIAALLSTSVLADGSGPSNKIEIELAGTCGVSVTGESLAERQACSLESFVKKGLYANLKKTYIPADLISVKELKGIINSNSRIKNDHKVLKFSCDGESFTVDRESMGSLMRKDVQLFGLSNCSLVSKTEREY